MQKYNWFLSNFSMLILLKSLHRWRQYYVGMAWQAHVRDYGRYLRYFGHRLARLSTNCEVTVKTERTEKPRGVSSLWHCHLQYLGWIHRPLRTYPILSANKVTLWKCIQVPDHLCTVLISCECQLDIISLKSSQLSSMTDCVWPGNIGWRRPFPFLSFFLVSVVSRQ